MSRKEPSGMHSSGAGVGWAVHSLGGELHKVIQGSANETSCLSVLLLVAIAEDIVAECVRHAHVC